MANFRAINYHFPAGSACNYQHLSANSGSGRIRRACDYPHIRCGHQRSAIQQGIGCTMQTGAPLSVLE